MATRDAFIRLADSFRTIAFGRRFNPSRCHLACLQIIETKENSRDDYYQ
jgi:hypothetical protein